MPFDDNRSLDKIDSVRAYALSRFLVGRIGSSVPDTIGECEQLLWTVANEIIDGVPEDESALPHFKMLVNYFDRISPKYKVIMHVNDATEEVVFQVMSKLFR